MNTKRRSVLSFFVMMPVLILGIVSILSNIMAVVNIQNVNGSAASIADHGMDSVEGAGDDAAGSTVSIMQHCLIL